MKDDRVVICSPSYEDEATENLIRHPLPAKSKWDGKKVKDYPKAGSTLLVMIQRGEERIIPNGETILHSGDVLVMLSRK